MYITAVYASLLGLLFFLLSVRTVMFRRQFNIAVGDGGNRQMLRAMRAHANFAEYVPMALVLIYFMEEKGASIVLVHALGAGLLIGRCSHAYGISRLHEKLRFRIFGMAMTFFTILVSSIDLLISYLQQVFFSTAF